MNTVVEISRGEPTNRLDVMAPSGAIVRYVGVGEIVHGARGEIYLHNEPDGDGETYEVICIQSDLWASYERVDSFKIMGVIK